MDPPIRVSCYIFHLSDVGLVPYDGDHPRVLFSNDGVMKYLATGKPVVTSCEASAEVLSPHVSVAKDGPGCFAEAVDQALVSHDSKVTEERRAFACEHTLEKRVQPLSAWMGSLL